MTDTKKNNADGNCWEINYYPARDDFSLIYHPGQPDEAEIEIVYADQMMALQNAIASALLERGDVDAEEEELEEVDDEDELETDSEGLDIAANSL